MNKGLIVLSIALAAGAAGCNDRIGRGAAIGGAGGAAIGAVAPGVGVVEGAAIGAAAGAVIGALGKDDKGRDWYRDQNDNKYWVDKNDRRHYD